MKMIRYERITINALKYVVVRRKGLATLVFLCYPLSGKGLFSFDGGTAGMCKRACASGPESTVSDTCCIPTFTRGC
jgi:hypothetical protein